MIHRFLRSALSFSVFAFVLSSNAFAGTPPFSDLGTYGSTFFHEIYQLKDLGIIKGQADGTLDGVSELNRAEMVALLIQASGMTEEEVLECSGIGNGQESYFIDVPVDNSDWYTAPIYCAYNKGWISGDDTTHTFRPADPVNLAEASVTFLRYFVGELPEEYIEVGGDWYDPYISYLTDLDILEQWPEGPGFGVDFTKDIIGTASAEIHRASAFALFYRLQVSVQDGGLTPYYPVVDIDAIDSLEAELTGDTFTLTNTAEGFQVEGIPLPEGGIDEMRFWVEFPEGDSNGYLSITHVLYPYTPLVFLPMPGDDMETPEHFLNEICVGLDCYQELLFIETYDFSYFKNFTFGDLEPFFVSTDQKVYYQGCLQPDLAEGNLIEDEILEMAEDICVPVVLDDGTSTQMPNEDIELTVIEPTANNFTLLGTNLYYEDELLFESVEDVSSVLLGPDGHTVHFQLEEDYPAGYHPTCADLETEIDPFYSNNDNPKEAPWDYQSIDSAGTIGACDGGYIYPTDYFAYLEVSDSSTWTLYVKDQSSQTTYEFELDESVFDFDDHLHTLEPIEGHNGYIYYYAERSALVADDKLVVTFGAVIVAVDLTEERVIGYDVQNHDYFYLSYVSELPFVALVFAYEGPGGAYTTLFDLSGSELKKHSLSELDLPHAFTPLIEALDDGLIIHDYELIYITGQVSEEDVDIITNSSDTDLVRATISRIEEDFMATGEYVDVTCFNYLSFECAAFLEGQDYFIESGGEIQPLN